VCKNTLSIQKVCVVPDPACPGLDYFNPQNRTRMSKAAVVNVRLPREVISWLDSLVEKKIYNSRSEAIREFSRDYVIKHRGAT